jgi:hypothetical protein
MKLQIHNILHRAEGRYLTEQEGASLRGWASGLEERLAAMAEVHRNEETIMQTVMKAITAGYPDFLRKYSQGSEKGIRDMSIVLRYAAHAMVLQDMTYLEDNLLNWLGTVLRGIGFTPQFLEDAYGTMERASRDQLSPKAAGLIAPYLEHCRVSLTSREKPIAAASA